MILIRVLCISDVRTFLGADLLLKAVRPNWVILLGDILYDGPGQFYLIGKENFKFLVSAFRNVGLSEDHIYEILLNILRFVVYDPWRVSRTFVFTHRDDALYGHVKDLCCRHSLYHIYEGPRELVNLELRILGRRDVLTRGFSEISRAYLFYLRGNTHDCRLLEALHKVYFLNFMRKCDKCGVNTIVIVLGNHDSDVDYYNLIKENLDLNCKLIFVRDTFFTSLAGLYLTFLSYDYLRSGSLEDMKEKLVRSNVIFVHAELKDLRRIVKLLYNAGCMHNKLIVSGHFGYGYYSPDRLAEALVTKKSKLGKVVFSANGYKYYPELVNNEVIYLVRIDSFPESLCVLNLTSSSVEGKLLKYQFLVGSLLTINSFTINF